MFWNLTQFRVDFQNIQRTGKNILIFCYTIWGCKKSWVIRVKEICLQMQPRQTDQGLEQKIVQVCFLLLKLLYGALQGTPYWISPWRPEGWELLFISLNLDNTGRSSSWSVTNRNIKWKCVQWFTLVHLTVLSYRLSLTSYTIQYF